MEKKNTPLAPWGDKVKQNWKKVLIVFTYLIVFISCFLMAICPYYQIGFKYFENSTTEIGITQIENFDTLVLKNYLCKVQEDGFEIESGNINDSISSHWGIYRRESINQEELEKNLEKYINVKVTLYKLTIPDDEIIYCFKNESECNDFAQRVKEYNSELEIGIQKTIGETSDISSGDVLENKINKLEEEKQEEKTLSDIRTEKEDKYHEIESLREYEKEVLSKAHEAKEQVVAKTIAYASNGQQRSNSCCVLPNYTCISSYYGMRNGSMHTGIDLAAASGTEVYAWKNGSVEKASWSSGYGNFIIINHEDGTTSRYAHLNGYAVSAGDIVSQGQVIGYVGSTGRSTGPHLHWEVLVNGNFVNPFSYL